MTVVEFDKQSHYGSLVECLSARNAYIPGLKEMPKVGYVTYNGEQPVAFAFLRKVEGGFGQIDGLTSNPECSAEDRHQGIDLAVSALLDKAKKLNIFQLMFTSEDAGTIMRSEKYGFKKSPLTVLVGDLTKRSV